MTSALELLPVAAGEFGRRVHALRPGDWTNPTPDTEWTVRDLVNHLVAEHLWAPPLLAGQGLHDVGDRFDGDVLGADPTATWDAAIEASLRAWAAAADEDTVALSVGPQERRLARTSPDRLRGLQLLSAGQQTQPRP